MELSTDGPSFSLSCAARGFHEYRKIWAPRINQQLIVKHQSGNLFDPYAIGLFTKIRGKIEPLSLVGHLPREISRFSKFLLEYGGNMKASVRDIKFRRSPLPQGGLEIPITLTILRNNASLRIYDKMQEFAMGYYMETEIYRLKLWRMKMKTFSIFNHTRTTFNTKNTYQMYCFVNEATDFHC